MTKRTQRTVGPKGFSLGNYWIASSGILGVFFLPFAFFMTIVSQAVTDTTFGINSMVAGVVMLVFCVLFILSAVGMYVRRMWGVYFAYGALLLEFLLGLSVILFALMTPEGTRPPYVIQLQLTVGITLVGLSVLWWLYFYSRHDMFS